MPIKINGLNTGSVTLSASATGGDVTLNLPNANGTVATTSYADTAPGLQFIVSASLSGSSVSVNNCFSATYANYRIIVARSNTSTGANPLLRLRLSGTDATTNYTFQNIQAISTSLSGARSTAQTSFRYGSVNTTADDCAQILDLFSPAIAASTFIQSYSVNTGSTPVFDNYFGAHTTATAYDGITFLPSAGTWSAGTVFIYGYRSS